ncbi:bZIP transcription factor [Apiospora arundinis]|uniref:BZIP transcription factor n=1 Tax=Apiospora arundinis TaxID=335852 RepID=A0ABR2J7I4_9PEZI
MSDKMSIDKKDPSKENSEDESPVSTPENEAGPSNPSENQPAKRKGGRKPIYATSEERKQRNRQAQAAFRERRTEYIKQLEETIRVHEGNLTSLQTAHRSAADECLMLRYKNSLLERILLEKGIDVQAELRAKTGSPNLGPTHMAPNMVQPPPIQRTMFNRHHHSRRSGSSIAPKLEAVTNSLPPPLHGIQAAASPKTRPTPPSHAASPTNPNPTFGQPVTSPSTADQPGIRSTLPQPMRPPLPPMQGPMAAAAARQQMLQAGASSGANPASRTAPFYPTQSFQNHIEQLGKLTQQEYDAPNDMIDEVEPDTPGPGPYPTQYAGGQQPQAHQNHQPHHQPQQQHGMPMQSVAGGASGQQAMPQGEQQPGHSQGQGYPSMTQLLDPALDWDPFGLSASMQFPTQFSFDTSNMR